MRTYVTYEELASQRRSSPVTTKDKIRRTLWTCVQATLFRYSFHTWNGWRATLLRSFGARIGRECTIRRTSRVYYPWLLEIGDLTSLGDKAEIYNLGRVSIGARVTISQEAYVCAGTHDYTRLEMPLLTPPIFVEDDAWIGARAFLMPGIRVGRGAILAATGTAIHDLEPWTIYGGNPARQLKARPILGSDLPVPGDAVH